MFNKFSERFYNAAFALKCVATVALVVIAAAALTATTGIGGLALAAAVLPQAKGIYNHFENSRQASKERSAYSKDAAFEGTIPRENTAPPRMGR